MCKYKVKKIYGINLTNEIKVKVPGSKSITNRALMLAALAEGKSVIEGALFSEDSRNFLQCLIDLGFEIEVNENECKVSVTGHGGEIPKKEASIYVGSAGTAARFLTAMLGLSKGVYHLDASKQMRKRPMKPLLDALVELGAKVTYEGEKGYFPFTISNEGGIGDSISVDIAHSSQFLSALLMSAVLVEHDFKIDIIGTHGMSYISITTKMMSQFGCTVEYLTDGTYLVKGGQKYNAMKYQVEPDVSAGCYFYAMAPLLGINVLVKDIFPDSMQGDIKFIDILAELGCKINNTSEGIMIQGIPGGKYDGIEVNMSACSDQTMTLAAIAPYANTPTTIKNIGHIKFQESNRLEAIVTELSVMGIKCESTDEEIKIYPGNCLPAEIETYEDHRMAMAFSLTGLRSEGIVIKNPECCAKTFESYFNVLDSIIGTLLGKIQLKGSGNTRDLGGYLSKDGRKIKPRKLIRSAELSALTESDIEILVNEYDLKVIIDFRTQREVLQKPDVTIEGARYIRNPIFDEKVLGVTREAVTEITNPVELMISYVCQMNGKILSQMESIYLGLVTNEYAINQYSKFFDILLDNEEGAVLWHCSAGKDRVGFGTALLLSALGVELDTVIEDYLYTNDCVKEQNSVLMKAVSDITKDPEIQKGVEIVNTVHRNLLESTFAKIDKVYGSLESFLENQIGLSSDKIERLKDKYLICR